MKEVRTTINFPPYNYEIHIVFTDNLVDSAEKLVKAGELRANHSIDETTDGFHVRMPNQAYSYVVLKLNSNANQIAHESYHAVSNMFKWIGAEHEEELFAYHLGYTIEMVTDDQKKAKKKLDKRVK